LNRDSIAGEDVVGLEKENMIEKLKYMDKARVENACLPIIDDRPISHQFADSIRRTGIKGVVSL